VLVAQGDEQSLPDAVGSPCCSPWESVQLDDDQPGGLVRVADGELDEHTDLDQAGGRDLNSRFKVSAGWTLSRLIQNA
jgi:hypothetical protein